MKYSIHGSYKIKKSSNGLIEPGKDVLKEFWENIDQKEPGLSSACGCYLFAVKAGLGIRPWYIGMTTKRSFAEECLGSHQCNIYNNVIAKKKGTALLFLIAKRTNKDKFVKPSIKVQKDISYLETILIGAGIEKNKEIQNIRKTKLLRTMIVPGLINTPPGPPSLAEREFVKALIKD